MPVAFLVLFPFLLFLGWPFLKLAYRIASISFLFTFCRGVAVDMSSDLVLPYLFSLCLCCHPIKISGICRPLKLRRSIGNWLQELVCSWLVQRKTVPASWDPDSLKQRCSFQMIETRLARPEKLL